MKKLLLGMAFMLMGSFSFSVMAEEGEETVIISWDEASTDSFDDMKIGEPIEVEDYATFTLTACGYEDISSEESRLRLKMIIMNTQIKEAMFVNTSSVKVIYDDKYEFDGEIKRMYNTPSDEDFNNYASNDIIKPLYYGSYEVGCLVPKIVKETDKPLRIEFKVDDLEFVYHVRE